MICDDCYSNWVGVHFTGFQFRPTIWNDDTFKKIRLCDTFNLVFNPQIWATRKNKNENLFRNFVNEFNWKNSQPKKARTQTSFASGWLTYANDNDMMSARKLFSRIQLLYTPTSKRNAKLDKTIQVSSRQHWCTATPSVWRIEISYLFYFKANISYMLMCEKLI